jgi:hypothetical protein
VVAKTTIAAAKKDSAGTIAAARLVAWCNAIAGRRDARPLLAESGRSPPYLQIMSSTSWAEFTAK